MKSKAEKRDQWLREMADPVKGRFKASWWAGSLTAADLEEWVLELRERNKALYAAKLRAYTELGWAGEWNKENC